MAGELGGKVALITGSGRGLGNAMARKIAAQGADVAVHDLSFEETGRFGEAADLGEVVATIEGLGVRSVGCGSTRSAPVRRRRRGSSPPAKSTRCR